MSEAHGKLKKVLIVDDISMLQCRECRVFKLHRFQCPF